MSAPCARKRPDRPLAYPALPRRLRHLSRQHLTRRRRLLLLPLARLCRSPLPCLCLCCRLLLGLSLHLGGLAQQALLALLLGRQLQAVGQVGRWARAGSKQLDIEQERYASRQAAIQMGQAAGGRRSGTGQKRKSALACRAPQT